MMGLMPVAGHFTKRGDFGCKSTILLSLEIVEILCILCEAIGNQNMTFSYRVMFTDQLY